MGKKNKQNAAQWPGPGLFQQVEENKGEDKPKEEEKKEEKNEEEKKNTQNPKGEIVLGVYIHCQGCATQVVKSLMGFEGVEEIVTDSKNHKVIVKGKKADPWKVVERLKKKTQKHVELISPKVSKDAKEKEEKEKAEAAKKEEERQVVVAVLKVYMHCENCAHDVKKCIERMEGVTSVEPDLKRSQMVVKGTFDPQALVKFVYKRAGKYVEIVKQEKIGKNKGDDRKGEKNEGEGGNKKGKGGQPLFLYYPPQIVMEQAYPPQTFSDENVNSCSVM